LDPKQASETNRDRDLDIATACEDEVAFTARQVEVGQRRRRRICARRRTSVNTLNLEKAVTSALNLRKLIAASEAR